MCSVRLLRMMKSFPAPFIFVNCNGHPSFLGLDKGFKIFYIKVYRKNWHCKSFFLRKTMQIVLGGDFRMLFYNADGSEGEMCGNGARCICRRQFRLALVGQTGIGNYDMGKTRISQLHIDLRARCGGLHLRLRHWFRLHRSGPHPVGSWVRPG